MKTNLLFLSLPFLFCHSIFAQSYTEGSDLPNTGSGPAFTVSGPSITIAGTLNTPSDGQDRFQITIPAGCLVTSVTYSMTDTAHIGVNGFAQFGSSNQQATPPLSASFANGPSGAFPVGPGTYDCMMVANIAANDSWSMVFNTSCTTGIDENNSADPISVYPNPAAQTIFFETNSGNQKDEIIISDQLGRIVSTKNMDGDNKVEFSVADLSEGMYFYRILGDEKILSTGKFIVRR